MAEQAFHRNAHPGQCEVCGKETMVVVCSSSMGPFSFAYCEDCLRAGAEPYWFLVNVISMSGTWPDSVNEACQEKIRSVLKYLSRSEDDFKADVYKANHELPVYAGGCNEA